LSLPYTVTQSPLPCPKASACSSAKYTSNRKIGS